MHTHSLRCTYCTKGEVVSFYSMCLKSAILQAIKAGHENMKSPLLQCALTVRQGLTDSVAAAPHSGADPGFQKGGFFYM